jgi:hypothetical protein
MMRLTTQIRRRLRTLYQRAGAARFDAIRHQCATCQSIDQLDDPAARAFYRRLLQQLAMMDATVPQGPDGAEREA